jgi:hypothetical protein
MMQLFLIAGLVEETRDATSNTYDRALLRRNLQPVTLLTEPHKPVRHRPALRLPPSPALPSSA